MCYVLAEAGLFRQYRRYDSIGQMESAIGMNQQQR